MLQLFKTPHTSITLPQYSQTTLTLSQYVNYTSKILTNHFKTPTPTPNNPNTYTKVTTKPNQIIFPTNVAALLVTPHPHLAVHCLFYPSHLPTLIYLHHQRLQHLLFSYLPSKHLLYHPQLQHQHLLS
jgi:hypothetical protein